MAVWNDLPTEIIAMILYHLDEEHDMAIAMTVCYRFRAILEPKLYTEATFLLSDIPRCCRESGSSGNKYGQLRLFLHTILTRPELGSRVRNLSLYASSTEEKEEREQLAQATPRCGCADQAHWQVNTSQPLSDETISPADVVSAAAAQRGLPHSVVESGPSGLVVLLLHHLPQLSTLFLCCGNEDLDIIASAAGGHLEGGTPAGLRSLKCLEIQYDEQESEDYGFSIYNVAYFMSLPSLSSFCVGAFGDGHGDYDEGDYHELGTSEWIHNWIPPRSLPITQFRLTGSQVHCNTINLLLGLPERLESFECVGFGGGGLHLPDFHASLLLPGLRMHASSLTELLITNINYDPDPSTLGSLDTFTALRHLRLPIGLLMKGTHEFNGDPTMTPKGEDIARRNPLDTLLPPALVTLELELNPDVTLKAFMTATGIPATLLRTSHHLPFLREFIVVPSRWTRGRARQDDVDLENAELAAGLCRPSSQSDLHCGHEIEFSVEGIKAYTYSY